MRAVKCPQCAFVGIPEEGFCKSCGWSLEVNPNALPKSVRRNRPGRGVKFKLKVAFGLLAFAALISGIVVAHVKLTKYFDKTPQYLAAISEAEKFKEPITIKANRDEIPPSNRFEIVKPEKKAGKAVAAADVLEAAGLITMSVETTTSTVTQGYKQYGAAYTEEFKKTFGSGGDRLVDVKADNLMIRLTEKGRQEAINWKETPELSKTETGLQRLVSWWIIPIGDREILRIDSVTPVPGDGKFETVEVMFRWRWRPNKLGEYFDMANPNFSALPAKAQTAVLSLRMSSQAEDWGHAKLQKQGGIWECIDITFRSELVDGIKSAAN